MYKFLILVLLHSSVFAWWDAGHMAIAQIAYERLEPKVKNKVNKYIEVFADPFPTSATFVPAACWADDINGQGIKAFFPWHGSALPYDPEGILSQYKTQQIKNHLKGRDIIAALEQSVKTLTHPRASRWAKGLMLRFLIHFVGDIHQPMHCITLYNHHFPKGDLAGNFFRIPGSNLHAYWDSICGLGSWRLRRPLDEEGQVYLDDLVNQAIAAYPEEFFSDLEITSFSDWREESYKLAIDFAYAGIKPREMPSAVYTAEAQQVALRQIALAGYRLADLLNASLGNHTTAG